MWKKLNEREMLLLSLFHCGCEARMLGKDTDTKKTKLWNKILSVPFFNFGGCSGRDRTCDQVINSHLLYR